MTGEEKNVKQLGFIGMGNMARAIASGFAAAGVLRGEEMAAYAPRYERLKAFSDTIGMTACASLEELLENSDMLLMAVKPYVVDRKSVV